MSNLFRDRCIFTASDLLSRILALGDGIFEFSGLKRNVLFRRGLCRSLNDRLALSGRRLGQRLPSSAWPCWLCRGFRFCLSNDNRPPRGPNPSVLRCCRPGSPRSFCHFGYAWLLLNPSVRSLISHSLHRSLSGRCHLSYSLLNSIRLRSIKAQHFQESPIGPARIAHLNIAIR